MTGDSSAYAYLTASTEGFLTPEELRGAMEQAGLVNVSCRSFMFGTMAIHAGRRPAG